MKRAEKARSDDYRIEYQIEGFPPDLPNGSYPAVVVVWHHQALDGKDAGTIFTVKQADFVDQTRSHAKRVVARAMNIAEEILDLRQWLDEWAKRPSVTAQERMRRYMEVVNELFPAVEQLAQRAEAE